MEAPEDTVAIGAKGKKEARILKSKGAGFIVYGYRDVETAGMLSKYSILLRLEDGSVEHFFIVPAGGRELVVKHAIEKQPKKRGIYDEKAKKAVYF